MFRSSHPATGDAFHDRDDALARLISMVEELREGRPSWLAILGDRKIGKTSLLLELERRAHHPDVAFVLLDTLDYEPLSMEIFRTYALRVADRILGPVVGESLEALRDRPAQLGRALDAVSASSGVDASLRSFIRELPAAPLTHHLVRQCIGLPDMLAAAVGKRVVVAIDEFQELEAVRRRRDALEPLPVLRSIWQRHEHVSYIISGSARTMLTRLITAKASPFFQHFAVLDLGPFDRTDAVALLERHAPRDRRIPRALAGRAYDLLGGHPFYLQLFGEALCASPAPYDDEDFKLAAQQLLFSRTGRLSLYFEGEYRRLVGRSTQLAAILSALADGPKRLTDISRASGMPTGATAAAIERLGDALVHREDRLYGLRDHTFGVWLRWREPGGSVVPMSLVGSEAEAQVAAHFARIGFDLIYQSRASRGAFDLLALRGGFALGVQVRRTALPLRLTKTELKRMSADAKRLGWSWVIAAVDPEDTEVRILDPSRAKRGKEIRLTAAAVIDNVLAWLDEL